MSGNQSFEAQLHQELSERINSQQLPRLFSDATDLDREALDATILRIIDPRNEPGRERRRDDFQVERIIREFKRPSLLVRNGSFEPVESEVWSHILERFRPTIEETLPAVGRIELKNHSKYAWVGTGFLVERDILATNRHVAEEFARRDGEGFAWRRNDRGKIIRPRVDFREEHNLPDEEEFDILEVLYLAPDDAPDVALLRVDATDLQANPLTLQEESENVEFVGAVGYPWRDSRVEEPHLIEAMDRYFRGVFDVKRFAPGLLIPVEEDALGHDCTVLGGNSGSALVDLATGGVVGLHYGSYSDYNVAVPAPVLREILTGL